jgi:hypothetical protein
MTKRAELKIGNRSAVIELFEDQAPQAVVKIWNLLPIDVPLFHAKFAGDELIFMVPLVLESEFFKEKIESGDVLYYPIQQTICLFFGDHIVPFGPGPFNAIGRIIDGFMDLAYVAELIRKKGFHQAHFARILEQ